ncbi:hypothetical protein P5P86_19995 [Nocardioides sp. BP30]|uniref:hypothetical protein n=1 Tax=Nocardioides sp. BP30 TaxID=3036374 RepID=UPI002468A4A3|nr:hypothetical protein [Nocardioides sp. BP30]WGL52220.1 hypothetical protein P5P86_19995 [Nocardioides sp. BP30]
MRRRWWAISVVVVVMPSLGAGCSTAGAGTKQAAVRGYLAAIGRSDARGLRAYLAYQPDGDPASLVTGARIPLACARREEQRLLRLRLAAGDPVRWDSIAPPTGTTDHGASSTRLDLAYFRRTDGSEEGRQVIEVGGSWFVLAEVNEACNRLLE